MLSWLRGSLHNAVHLSSLRPKRWGNFANGVTPYKNTSESYNYNFTSTLAIEMYLGKHYAYSILNTSQARWAAAILPCCDREVTSGRGRKYSCKNIPDYQRIWASSQQREPDRRGSPRSEDR